MIESNADIVLDQDGSALAAAEHPSTECDAAGARRSLRAALAWLEQHAEAINALNVFPVPDGDTGTNMVLTLRAAVAEGEGYAGHHVGEYMRAVAHGALMGARGNSGVILSQLLRGAAQAIAAADQLSPRLLADAFASARDTAYQGVMRPVEGTILTVAKEVAAAAVRAARNETIEFRQLLAVSTDAARHAVAATPTQLQVLADAGVVDAGGQGLFVVLEGMHRFASGMGVEYNGTLRGSVDLAAFGHEELYGYDTQFIIHGRGLDVGQIREALSPLGDSLLVVGDGTDVKVHIHTDRPGDPLNLGVTFGSVSDVVVENMQEQYQTFIAHRTAERVATATAKRVGIVAVSQGEGFKRVLESLGADVVVEGGQTMNPSVEQLLAAANSLAAESVILLPNNSNIIMAAQHVQEMAAKRVSVIPTRTLPEGISALLAYNYELDADDNSEAMTEASRQTQTIELTRATRSAVINGLKVKEGQYIAIVNTELRASDGNLTRALLKGLKTLGDASFEIATIYRGQDAEDQLSSGVVATLEKRFPELEIEVVEGGQPHYQFIVALE